MLETKKDRRIRELEEKVAELERELRTSAGDLDQALGEARGYRRDLDAMAAVVGKLEAIARPFLYEGRVDEGAYPFPHDTLADGEGNTVYRVAETRCSVCGELIEPVEFRSELGAMAYEMSAIACRWDDDPYCPVHGRCAPMMPDEW